MFEPDDGHLRLLVEFGLGTDRGGPWHARLNSGHGTPAQLLEDQLVAAAFDNRPEWARLALAAGADPDGLGTRHPLRLGLTPYEAAVRRGNREVAELLRAAGATVPPLDPVEAFLSACMAGDRATVDRLRAERPALARKRSPAGPTPSPGHRAAPPRRHPPPGPPRLRRQRLGPDHPPAPGGLRRRRRRRRDAPGGRRRSRRRATPGTRSTPFGWARHARREAVMELLRTLPGGDEGVAEGDGSDKPDDPYQGGRSASP